MFAIEVEQKIGPTLRFEGAAHLRVVDGLIGYQRDYWDTAASLAQMSPPLARAYQWAVSTFMAGGPFSEGSAGLPTAVGEDGCYHPATEKDLVDLVHPGFIYNLPVEIYVVDAGAVGKVAYDPALYTFGNVPPPDAEAQLEFAGYLAIAAALFALADRLAAPGLYRRWAELVPQAVLSLLALALPALLAFSVGTAVGPVDEVLDEEVCASQGAAEIDTLDAESDDTFDITPDCAGTDAE